MLAYLAIDFLFFLVWLALFIHRKDVRTQMIFFGIIMQPLAIFGYYSVPTYWHPPLFFGLPVGIEDLIGGFFLAGIAGVIYEEAASRHLRRMKERFIIKIEHWLVPVLVLTIALGIFFFFAINIMHTLVLSLIIGVFLMAILRHDLESPVVWSGIYFGTLYTIVFAVWLFIFPQAIQWWNLEVFWGITVLSVPLGEVLFGFLYGAFWGPLYEFLFGYTLSKVKRK